MDILTIGLWSYHMNRDVERNETHNLVGYQHEHAYVATYKNSYRKTSYVAAYVTDKGCWHGICADIMIGGVSGYEEQTKMKVTPFIVPRLRFDITERIGVGVIAIPTKVVAAGFEVRF